MDQKTDILAFVGMTGSGRGYAINQIYETYGPDKLHIIPRRSTREVRQDDCLDQKAQVFQVIAGMVLENYNNQVEAGQIIFDHAPIAGKPNSRYGYLADDLHFNGQLKIIEPNLQHLEQFKQMYPKRMHVIGMWAQEQYIAHNLSGRGDKPEEIQKRLNSAMSLKPDLDQAYTDGLIDQLLEVNFENRDKLAPYLVDIAGKMLSYMYTFK